MTTFSYKLKIDQGATFDRTFTWKAGEALTPVDLTGVSSARMQVRATAADPAVLVELSTTNGRLVLGGVAGTVRILLPATVTAGFAWTSGVYDLELTYSDGRVVRLLEGSVAVSPEVTRG